LSTISQNIEDHAKIKTPNSTIRQEPRIQNKKKQKNFSMKFKNKKEKQDGYESKPEGPQLADSVHQA